MAHRRRRKRRHRVAGGSLVRPPGPMPPSSPERPIGRDPATGRVLLSYRKPVADTPLTVREVLLGMIVGTFFVFIGGFGVYGSIAGPYTKVFVEHDLNPLLAVLGVAVFVPLFGMMLLWGLAAWATVVVGLWRGTSATERFRRSGDVG